MTAAVDRTSLSLPLLTLASASLAILALSQPSQVPLGWGFVFKPLTTLLIIWQAWRRRAAAPRLARWLRAGLVCSLVGDVALLWPEAGFLPGLVSFLLAHICYILAFCTRVRLGAVRWPFLLFGVIAAVVLGRLWTFVPPALQPPVVVYVAALAVMASQAWAWWRACVSGPEEGQARWAAWGGTLFVFSDAMLAINKFAGPVDMASLWVLASYWPAQWCMAQSVGRAAKSGAA
ncbi:Uncharacterized membrane protein YhhN [Roseateles sp. YR242]|uniref:lysoplasmalogenase n=1 Tax=Roseateles sp. YR242 TaxID=1855305 RepID=UPI0008C80A64|nr:lysoplasmalogenase [Roseateles sp. YR242]SEK76972.1 Uncharacterized membrane protein YhhN [Roseateles sp. YR242]